MIKKRVCGLLFSFIIKENIFNINNSELYTWGKRNCKLHSMLLSWMLLNGHDEYMAKFHTRAESTIIGSQFERVSLYFLSFSWEFLPTLAQFLLHLAYGVKSQICLSLKIWNTKSQSVSPLTPFTLTPFLLSVLLSEILPSSSLQFVLDLYQSMVHLHQSVYDCRCVRHRYAIALVSHRELCCHLMCFFFPVYWTYMNW